MGVNKSTGSIAIALGKFDPDPKNVRRTYTESGIRELAASIKANGLLQNSMVRAGKNGRYFIIAGGRRLAALRLLVEAGNVAADLPVECRLRDAGEAMEISLAENTIREAMTPRR
jgi:ParB family chromosome partitioning protein